MSTTPEPPHTAKDEDIPFVIKVSLPCVAAVLLVFFSLFLIVRSCNRRRRCCGEKDGDAFERGTEYSVLEPNGRTVFYPQHASNPNSMTHSELQNDRRHGKGIGGFEEKTVDQAFLQNRENSQTVMHRDTGVNVRLEPRLKDFGTLNAWREHTSNDEGQPSRSGLTNCYFGLENDLYPGHADRRKSDGEVEVFKPGQKGYISMSSTNRGRQPSCRSKAEYITARPEMRRPVNVCYPLAKPIVPSNISEETQQETSLSTSDVNQLQVKNPIYERLDRYYRPSRRVESCPSSRLHARRMDRGQYDSLPMLPLELSTVEIPIGPFVSCDKGDRNISETEDCIKHRDSFENMFDGAWWHSESDIDDSPPRVPDKQLRKKNTDRPSAMGRKIERPTSYVTMNRKNRHERDCRTCKNGAISSSAATLPNPIRPNHGSYMTHGQMMRGRKPREEEDTPTAYENYSHSLPPLPTPCSRSLAYVNFQNAEST